jgi:superfamily II DNA helicase RecQ
MFLSLAPKSDRSLGGQLPAVVSCGVTVVISPLLSLIQDQVCQLIEKFSIPAAFLNSTTTTVMGQQVYRDLLSCRRGKEPAIKLLYLTPERIVKSESLKDILHELHDKVGRTTPPMRS